MQRITLVLCSALVALAADATLLISGQACNCTSIKLDCSERNKSRVIPQEICTNTTTLNLDNNKFDVFPDGLQDFEEVSANCNFLTRLPSISQLNPQVKFLRLKSNNINTISDELRSFSSLEELLLDDNEISSLDFLPQPCNLRILSMLRNNISTLYGRLQSCANLTYLYFSSGNIKILSNEIFSGMSHLEELEIIGHKIASVPDGTFRNLKELKNLRLYSNFNMSVSERSFQGLSSLEVLDLSMCGITMLPSEVFRSTPRLEDLDLRVNNLSFLPPDVFSGLHWLTKLHLDYNNLTEIPTIQDCCAHLEYMTLQRNNISSTSEDTLLSAVQGKAIVDLTNNPIRSFVLRWAQGATNVTVHVAEMCIRGTTTTELPATDLCTSDQCGAQNIPNNRIYVVNKGKSFGVCV